MDPLSVEDHYTFRKGVGILLYLSPERPDIMYVLKKLSTKPASPVEADLELLRHPAKYLKGSPELSRKKFLGNPEQKCKWKRSI